MPTPNPFRQVDGRSPDLTPPLRALPWADRAACVFVDPDLFFPPKGRVDMTRNAKLICSRCEVRAECLEYAMGDPSLEGIFGGLTEMERRAARKGRTA